MIVVAPNLERERRLRWWWASLAVLLAVALAVAVAAGSYAARSSGPAGVVAEARRGEWITLSGVAVRLDDVEIADSLPGTLGKPVVAPSGTRFVKVLVSLRPAPGPAPTLLCLPTLLADGLRYEAQFPAPVQGPGTSCRNAGKGGLQHMSLFAVPTAHLKDTVVEFLVDRRRAVRLRP